jgi:hypothetical protein
MTQPDKTTRFRDTVLERILDTVVSIDRNVQDILDYVSDHYDDVKYKSDWDNADLGEHHDYE